MSAAKTLFLRDDNLVKASLAILKSDDFAKLVMFATVEFVNLDPTADQIIGMNKFLRTLRGMVDSEEVEPVVVGPELLHNLDVTRKSIAEPVKPKE